MDIDLNPGGPAGPDATLKAAEVFAEIVRYLNHATRDHAALRYPSDADRLLRDVSLAVSRLPQLCEQVAAWLHAEVYAGRVDMAHGSRFPNAGVAEDVMRLQLELAAARARELGKALDSAASVTSAMGAVED